MPEPVADVSAMMSGRTGVSAPPLAVIVFVPLATVAALLITKLVPAAATETTVVPTGMPLPLTTIPGSRTSPWLAAVTAVTEVLPSAVVTVVNESAVAIPAGTAVKATKFETLAPAALPRLSPRSRRDAPAVMAESDPVLNTRLRAVLASSVIVLPPTASVVTPPEAATIVRLLVERVAAALRAKVVPSMTVATVVPEAMPEPLTTMPAKSPAVLATLTMFERLFVAPAVMVTTLPSDSVVLAAALPRILTVPPPRVSVAPVPAPGMAPPPRRLLTLVTLLSSVSVPEALMVLPRKALVVVGP